MKISKNKLKIQLETQQNKKEFIIINYKICM